MEARDRIIVALDVSNLAQAQFLVQELAPHVGCFKVGLELLTSEGAPQVVRIIRDGGGAIFFDGKFMDSPKAVAGASRAVAELRVKMFNLHCLGGRAMMEAARKAVLDYAVSEHGPFPLILGVTILTSLNYQDLVELGIEEGFNFADPKVQAECEKDRIEGLVVRRLARLAQECGLDGVIASPQETRAIRDYYGEGFLIVTPAVRPEWAATQDQKRVMTPGEAIRAGADYLVIGRPITKPPPEIGTPADAAQKIAEEIATVL